MGGAKEVLDRAEQALNAGVQYGVATDALGYCEAHNVWWDKGGDDKAVYAYATACFKNGDDRLAGLTLEEVRDGVKQALGEAALDGCTHPYCFQNPNAKDD